jgi:hypothetical protein
MTTSPTATQSIPTPEAVAQARREERLSEREIFALALSLRTNAQRQRLIELALAPR